MQIFVEQVVKREREGETERGGRKEKEDLRSCMKHKLA